MSLTFTLEDLRSSLRSEQTAVDFSVMQSDLSLSKEDAEKLKQYFQFKIETLLESLQDVCFDGDESEARRLLSHIWIEYRMEWVRYNTQMQYQTVTLGQAKPLLMAVGAALSYLINVIERYLPLDELYWCTRLAADPIRYLSSRTELTSRMVSIAGAIGKAGHQVIERISKFKADTDQNEGINASTAQLQKTIDDVGNLLTSTMVLSLADLSNSLEIVLNANLKSSPIAIVISQDLSDSKDLSIPAETIAGLNQLFHLVLESLIKTSVESNIEERRQLGKTDHLQINWSVFKLSTGRMTFVLTDDGKGLLEIPSAEANLPRDWLLEYTNEPGKGSRVSANFRSTEIVSMMRFGAWIDGQMWHFAIPNSDVERIVPEENVLLRSDGASSIANIADEVLPYVDLGKMLSKKIEDINLESKQGQAFVQIKTSNGSKLIVGINAIYEHLRGYARTGASGVCFVEGYILVNHQLIAVVDVDLLSEVVNGTRPVSKAA